MTIRDLLTQKGLALTPSEARIAQVLLADYPISGLGTATSLARKAGVSDPTVVRLAVKLGFAGFPDFQAKLLAEVESRLHSPLLMMEAKRPVAVSDNPAAAYLTSVGRSLEKTVTAVPAQNYERAVRAIFDARGQVLLLGGRFSRSIASMLAGYLLQFRPKVRDLGAFTEEHFDLIVDLGKRDTLVVFDYRRYQRDTVAFARQAADRGVSIILFTDPWLSPIAEIATVVLVASIEVDSPYDTLAPAVAQAEALVAHAIAGMGRDGGRKRVEEVEAVRRANAVTIDAPARAAGRRDGKVAAPPPAPVARTRARK
jgi:DNA-binding MurR/RpiR family transcriptional regulator